MRRNKKLLSRIQASAIGCGMQKIELSCLSSLRVVAALELVPEALRAELLKIDGNEWAFARGQDAQEKTLLLLQLWRAAFDWGAPEALPLVQLLFLQLSDDFFVISRYRPEGFRLVLELAQGVKAAPPDVSGAVNAFLARPSFRDLVRRHAGYYRFADVCGALSEALG